MNTKNRFMVTNETLSRHMYKAKEYARRIQKIFKALQLLPLFVFAASLSVSYALWKDARLTAERSLQTSFDFRVRESNARIEQRMRTYEQVLRGAVGLFSASKTVTREDFRTYVDALNLTETYPGIQGIGFSVVVQPAELVEHVKTVRNEGFPNYDVLPKGPRSIYSSILYLEPFTGRNLRAFGYDMYSEPNRRAAMEQARDTGKGTVSNMVTLVQEAGNDMQSGFLMYLPVYRNGAPHDTLADRRKSFIGWIYAPFRMDDFMRGLNGERAGDLDIEIYDDGKISDETRMYDSNEAFSESKSNGKLKNISVLELDGRTWLIATTALPTFEESSDYDRSTLIFAGGITISLLVTVIIWLFLADRVRALHVAEQAMQLALYDSLTGLPNRTLYTERLTQALARAKRRHAQLALLFIDLDKFKPVNDTYGHAVGDILLKEVAKRLRKCMRASDTASRLGGDEFVVLLPDIEGERGAQVVAEKILHELSRSFEVAGHQLEISASIGAAIYPDDGSDEKTLIKNADFAMYDAKKDGRNNVKFAQATMRE
jgi:diguanylate cyclase (GGDEF)-like protein